MTISIEPLDETHRTAVLALAGDESLSWAAAPLPTHPADVDRLIANNRAGPRSVLTFAIRHELQVVGTVTLKRLEAEDNSAELSYWLGKAHQGKGYAFQAAQLALDHAFNALRLDYVHAHSLKDNNKPSIGVLRRLGFQPDPVRPDLKTEGRFAERYPDDHWTFFRLNRPVMAVR